MGRAMITTLNLIFTLQAITLKDVIASCGSQYEILPSPGVSMGVAVVAGPSGALEGTGLTLGAAIFPRDFGITGGDGSGGGGSSGGLVYGSVYGASGYYNPYEFSDSYELPILDNSHQVYTGGTTASLKYGYGGVGSYGNPFYKTNYQPTTSRGYYAHPGKYPFYFTSQPATPGGGGGGYSQSQNSRAMKNPIANHNENRNTNINVNSNMRRNVIGVV